MWRLLHVLLFLQILMNALLEITIAAEMLNALILLGALNVAVKVASLEMEVYALVSY